jgi:hypothetical protein
VCIILDTIWHILHSKLWDIFGYVNQAKVFNVLNIWYSYHHLPFHKGKKIQDNSCNINGLYWELSKCIFLLFLILMINYVFIISESFQCYINHIILFNFIVKEKNVIYNSCLNISKQISWNFVLESVHIFNPKCNI